jgi:hypothetical protein
MRKRGGGRRSKTITFAWWGTRRGLRGWWALFFFPRNDASNVCQWQTRWKMGTPDPLGDSKLFPNEKQIVVSTNFFLMKRKIIIL